MKHLLLLLVLASPFASAQVLNCYDYVSDSAVKVKNFTGFYNVDGFRSPSLKTETSGGQLISYGETKTHKFNRYKEKKATMFQVATKDNKLVYNVVCN